MTRGRSGPGWEIWATIAGVIITVFGAGFVFSNNLGKLEQKVEYHEKQIDTFNSKIDNLTSTLGESKGLPDQMKELRGEMKELEKRIKN